jgi:hypothetical protein
MDKSKWPIDPWTGEKIDPRILKRNIAEDLHPDSQNYKNLPPEGQRIADELLPRLNATYDRMLGKNKGK